jgi:hypothetical protein
MLLYQGETTHGTSVWLNELLCQATRQPKLRHSFSKGANAFAIRHINRRIRP